MRIHPRFTAVQGFSALTVFIVILATAWLVAVPDILTPLTFATVAGLLVAVAWVARITYENGQSTESVGQLLYNTEQAAASKKRHDNE